MPITNRSVETLKSCFLVKPGADRRKQFLRFLNGQITEIEEASESPQGTRGIFFRKGLASDFLALLREVEIELRKSRLSGASLVSRIRDRLEPGLPAD